MITGENGYGRDVQPTGWFEKDSPPDSGSVRDLFIFLRPENVYDIFSVIANASLFIYFYLCRLHPGTCLTERKVSNVKTPLSPAKILELNGEERII